MREAWKRAAGAVPWILLAAVGFSVLIRLTLQDTVPLLATVYYGSPPVIGCLLLAAAAGTWLLLGRLKVAAGVFGAVLLMAAWQAQISWHVHGGASGELKVLSWNTQRGLRGWDRLGGEIDGVQADLVCLIEAQDAERRLPQMLPRYEWCWFPEGLAAGIRGTVLDSEFFDFGAEGRAAVVKAVVKGRPLTLLLVDLDPDPFNPRRAGFERLDALRARVHPDVIAGDFNTPRDSVYFRSWRRGLRHAFETAGNGTDLTWPMPYPVLSIDHVWSGPRLLPRACRHEGSAASDHRAVVAELDWVMAEETAGRQGRAEGSQGLQGLSFSGAAPPFSRTPDASSGFSPSEGLPAARFRSSRVRFPHFDWIFASRRSQRPSNSCQIIAGLLPGRTSLPAARQQIRPSFAGVTEPAAPAPALHFRKAECRETGGCRRTWRPSSPFKRPARATASPSWSPFP